MHAPIVTCRAADTAAIQRAAEIVRRGGLVGFPTETVYGLGADATNDRAVATIFSAKNRPQFNPLIVHVPDIAAANKIVRFTPLAEKLARNFWPGALTLVLLRKPSAKLSLLVSAGLDTVAVRSPRNDIAQQLLLAAATPIAAPSANRSGKISPTTAAHVSDELGDALDIILDGGATTIGIESTVVGFEGDQAVLLRSGAVTREDLEAVAGPLAVAGKTISSPGQLTSHYAPKATLRLDVTSVDESEALLAFGVGPLRAAKSLNLSTSGDLHEAAANLFSMLRELDSWGPDRIAVSPIPKHGLGEAINDRLRRAAAPRGI